MGAAPAGWRGRTAWAGKQSARAPVSVHASLRAQAAARGLDALATETCRLELQASRPTTPGTRADAEWLAESLDDERADAEYRRWALLEIGDTGLSEWRGWIDEEASKIPTRERESLLRRISVRGGHAADGTAGVARALHDERRDVAQWAALELASRGTPEAVTALLELGREADRRAMDTRNPMGTGEHADLTAICSTVRRALRVLGAPEACLEKYYFRVP